MWSINNRCLPILPQRAKNHYLRSNAVKVHLIRQSLPYTQHILLKLTSVFKTWEKFTQKDGKECKEMHIKPIVKWEIFTRTPYWPKEPKVTWSHALLDISEVECLRYISQTHTALDGSAILNFVKIISDSLPATSITVYGSIYTDPMHLNRSFRNSTRHLESDILNFVFGFTENENLAFVNTNKDY